MKRMIYPFLILSFTFLSQADEVAPPTSSTDFCGRRIEGKSYAQLTWQEINAPVKDLLNTAKRESAPKEIETYAPLRSYLASKFSRECSSQNVYKTKATEVLVEECKIKKDLTLESIAATSTLIAQVVSRLNEQENKDIPITKGHLVEAHNLCVKSEVREKYKYTCAALEADWNSVKSQMTAYEQNMAFRELHERCIKIEFHEKGKTFEERYQCAKERTPTSAIVGSGLGNTFSQMGQDWINYRQQQWSFGLQQQQLQSNIDFWNSFDPTKYNAYMNSIYQNQYSTYGFANPSLFSNPFSFSVSQAN